MTRRDRSWKTENASAQQELSDAEQKLKDGETQTLDLPEHWDTTVTWSNDRGSFHADQKLESVTTGNLPVIEVSQKKPGA